MCYNVKYSGCIIWNISCLDRIHTIYNNTLNYSVISILFRLDYLTMVEYFFINRPSVYGLRFSIFYTNDQADQCGGGGGGRNRRLNAYDCVLSKFDIF